MPRNRPRTQAYERYRIQALIILNPGISRRSDRLKPVNKRVIGLYGESNRRADEPAKARSR